MSSPLCSSVPSLIRDGCGAPSRDVLQVCGGAVHHVTPRLTDSGDVGEGGTAATFTVERKAGIWGLLCHAEGHRLASAQYRLAPNPQA